MSDEVRRLGTGESRYFFVCAGSGLWKSSPLGGCEKLMWVWKSAGNICGRNACRGCRRTRLRRSLVTTHAGGWLFWVDPLCTELVLVFFRPSEQDLAEHPLRWMLQLGPCGAPCFSGEQAERCLEASEETETAQKLN